MRKWHRWLSVFFGIFLFWIAATGVLSQVAVLWPSGQPQAAVTTPPPGFTCPKGWRCMPPRGDGGLRGFVGTLHHLHSGESFGPVGTAVSVLSGLAMLFFAGSGLWLYIQMWRNRKSRALKPGWFWR